MLVLLWVMEATYWNPQALATWGTWMSTVCSFACAPTTLAAEHVKQHRGIRMLNQSALRFRGRSCNEHNTLQENIGGGADEFRRVEEYYTALV